MSIDLDYVQFEPHRRLVHALCERLQQDPEVIGILLKGSVARGDAYPGSDLDLQVLLRDGCARPFSSTTRDEIALEISYGDAAHAREKLAQRPMWVYAYLDGRILYDPRGALAALVEQAAEHYARFALPPEARKSLAYWLQGVRKKIAAALETEDWSRAAYYASTSSWQMLEGLWAVHDKPVPPAGAVWAHMHDLTEMPPGVQEAVHTLFEGDAKARVRAAQTILDWVLSHLDARSL